MNADLLTHFQKQLQFISNIRTEFSKAYPKTASNLLVHAGAIEDPHVTRLIEGFALLNARIHCKMDYDFGEFNSVLLNTIYPNYQTSIPAMSVIQLVPCAELSIIKEIPPETLLTTNNCNFSSTCFFTTRYAVTLQPIQINSVNLKDKQLAISIAGKLLSNKVRFYINAATPYSYLIYELLFQEVEVIYINSIALDRSILKPVGFSKDENLLPKHYRSFDGFDLIKEFFVLPEKFLFFDIFLPEKFLRSTFLDIEFCLKKTFQNLENYISNTNFLLNCTPVINLFSKNAEPILLTYKKTKYPVVPDIKFSLDKIKIYKIKRVSMRKSCGGLINCQPLFGQKYSDTKQEKYYWIETNKDKNVYLSFMGAKQYVNACVEIDLLCSNGNLPDKLSFRGEESQLTSLSLLKSVEKIICLKPFTSYYPSAVKGIEKNQQLISRFLLNHTNFCHAADGIKYLKEILSLYDFTDNHYLQEALLSLTSKTVNNETELYLEVDSTKFTMDNLFLFKTVLEKFFEQYAAINSVAKFSVISK